MADPEKFGGRPIAPRAMRKHTPWAGVTTVASGDSSVVVSDTQMTAKSGDLFNVGLGITEVASHGDLICFVTSVVDNVSFTLNTNLAVVSPLEVNYIVLT